MDDENIVQENGFKPRRSKMREEPPASVLTIEIGSEAAINKDNENLIWHELKNSHVSRTHLTGRLSKLEMIVNVGLMSFVYYKGQQIAIPQKEMMVKLSRPAGQSDYEYNDRFARILNRMLGADIDFIVQSISATGSKREAVASRKAAMLRIRRRYYLTTGTTGKPLIYPGRVVEARVVSVGQMAIRVEIFGVETSIRNKMLSWGYIGDANDHYSVGDVILVRVTKVEGTTPEEIRIEADVRSLTIDNTHEKLAALSYRTNYIGTVSDVRNGVIYMNLIDGIRAVAHACMDRLNRTPGRGDDVLFVCTHKDKNSGVAIGIVSRIIKRNI